MSFCIRSRGWGGAFELVRLENCLLTVANRQVTEELAEGSLPKKKQLSIFRQVTEERTVGSLPRGKEIANRGFRFRLSVAANRKSTQERAVAFLTNERKRLSSVVANRKSTQELAVAFLTNERKQLPNTAVCFS